MQNYIDSLRALRRPSLMIRAARFGLREYDRKKHLKRIFSGKELPAPGRAVAALIEAEAQHEAIRQEGAATYSVTRHLEALIALMAEAQLQS